MIPTFCNHAHGRLTSRLDAAWRVYTDKGPAFGFPRVMKMPDGNTTGKSHLHLVRNDCDFTGLLEDGIFDFVELAYTLQLSRRVKDVLFVNALSVHSFFPHSFWIENDQRSAIHNFLNRRKSLF